MFLVLILVSRLGNELVNAQGKCTTCTEQQCNSDKTDLLQNEMRVTVPWQLSKYMDYSVMDSNLRSLLSRQVNAEMQAFYTYLSMANFFTRDYVALPGFALFFQKSADEELGHARQIMDYMNKRGVPVLFTNVTVPCDHFLLTSELFPGPMKNSECERVDVKIIRKRDPNDGALYICDWRDPLTALVSARQVEMNVLRSIRMILSAADESHDSGLSGFFDVFVEEQVDSIKDMSDLITQLKRVEPCMGYHVIDRELTAKLSK